MPDRPPTLRDVAAAAGVHPATASRALNPETRLLVSEETARRVIAAAAAMGYRPNPVARSLRTRRSHSVGVLIPDLNNPIFPPIVRGLEDKLAAAGYVALLGNTDADANRERRLFEQMRARHVDGFVLATATLHDRLLAEAAAAELPVVLMNRLAPDYSFPSVSVDNEQGSRMAVTHLARLGHTRIAHIAGPQEASTSVGRLRGFRDGMASHGLGVDEDLIAYAARYTVEEGMRCGRELLAAHGDITAVAAANDMLAVGCYAALDEAGRQCPDDISVIGFNDMPFIDRLRPPLTSVRFPHYQLGTEAAQLLLERINGGGGPVKILYLAPEFIVRGSTAEPLAAAAQATPARFEDAGKAGNPPVPLRPVSSRAARGRPLPPLAGERQAVADRHHDQVHAVVGSGVIVEIPDGDHGRVVVARVDDAAMRERVVHHDQAAGAYPRYDLAPVAEVAVLVGIDEREVEQLLVRQRAQRVDGRAESQLYPVREARLLPVLPGHRGPLLVDVTAQQASAVRQPPGNADRGVPGEGADLDGGRGPGDLGQQGHERPLLGGDGQVGLVRELLSGLVRQLPEDGVRRAAVRGEVGVEVEADLLGTPRHETTL
jgi:LacI family transcriptional regulator